MTTVHYPRTDRKPEDVFTQKTLEQILAGWKNWQQGPGVIGRLNLHSCWGETSVLDRNYQGETMFTLTGQLSALMKLYNKTKSAKWRVWANAMASHILYLQDASGGFIHSTAEFEPTFDTTGCPIHFFKPIIALCRYYEWQYADEDIKSLIPAAVDRHFNYMVENIWRIGCASKHPLPFDGWCGVTNQDLVVTAAIAYQSKVFNHPERYEKYGKPVLDYYFSENYYYEKIGLFERGDGTNFAERTFYYCVILDALKLLYELLGEQRIIDVYDNVAHHIFDAAYVGKDGLTYLHRGAVTDPVDKTRILGWEDGSISFGEYAQMLSLLQYHVDRNPSEEKQRIINELEKTCAAWMFADGSLPPALFADNPLLWVTMIPDVGCTAEYIMDKLGDKLEDPKDVELPCICRKYKNFTFKQKGAFWAIEKDGKREYGGYSRFPAGVVKGEDGKLVTGSFDVLENPDFLEIID